jgi:hypothetical protein
MHGGHTSETLNEQDDEHTERTEKIFGDAY